MESLRGRLLISRRWPIRSEFSPHGGSGWGAQRRWRPGNRLEQGSGRDSCGGTPRPGRPGSPRVGFSSRAVRSKLTARCFWPRSNARSCLISRVRLRGLSRGGRIAGHTAGHSQGDGFMQAIRGGGRVSWRLRWRPTAGSSIRPVWRTCSPTPPTCSGVRCSGGKDRSISRCPGCRTTHQ